MRRGKAGRAGAAELIPLVEVEALACRGGGGVDDSVKQLLDLIIGTVPKPDQWPPLML